MTTGELNLLNREGEPLKIRHFSIAYQRIFTEIGTFGVKSLAANSITNNFIWIFVSETTITYCTVVHFLDILFYKR